MNPEPGSSQVLCSVPGNSDAGDQRHQPRAGDPKGGGVMKPKIIVLCGSSRFVQEMAVCAWLIERDEKAIAMGLHLLPMWYENCPAHHLAEHEGVAEAMDELHLCKIDLADEIFVVDCGGYIGDSTRREIEYATEQGKGIRWYTMDPIGDAVEKMKVENEEAPF